MGDLTEAVRRMLESLQITSASPGHINEVVQIDPSIDLDSFLPGGDEPDVKRERKKIDDTSKKVKRFDDGQVGDIQRMTTEQFSNIKELAKNPVGFMIRRVFGRFAKGVALIAFAFILVDVVKYVLDVLLFAPGKPWDKRFRFMVGTEILKFRRREEEQKLKQGFTQIIITTGPGLRGGQGQTYNTFNHIRDRSLPPGLGQPTVGLEASGLSTSKYKGSGRYRARFGR